MDNFWAWIQWLRNRLFSDEKRFTTLEEKVEQMAATIADLQAAVAAEDTVIESAVTLIQGLAKQIADLSPTQAAIDALATDVRNRAAALGAAVQANTPAAPVVTP
jgi:uncharacterized coiled-coil protein SlyX